MRLGLSASFVLADQPDLLSQLCLSLDRKVSRMEPERTALPVLISVAIPNVTSEVPW